MSEAMGAVSIDSFDSEVLFDFLYFAGTGFSATPSTGQLDSNNWIVSGLSDGDVAFGGTAATGDFARGADDNGASTGGVYAFYTDGSISDGGNVALGIQPTETDFTPGSFTLRLQNTTGSTITSLSIAYDLFVNNDEGRSNSLNFSYAIGGTDYDSGTLTSVSSLDYTSGDTADTLGWVSTSMSTELNGFSLAADDYVYFVWTGDDVGGSGSRDEFALDNVAIKATTSLVPEPTSALAGLLVAAGLMQRRRSRG